MNTFKTPPYGAAWQQVFIHAMLERRRTRTVSKIAEAERAITKRLHELPVSKENVEELQALMNAIDKLDRAKPSCQMIPFPKLK